MHTSLAVLVLAAVSILSCKASFHADVNTGTKQDEPDPFSDLREAPVMAPTTERTEYFGVARRLTLRSNTPPPDDPYPDHLQRDPRTATCECVAALVGSGREPDFDWHGERPGIGPDALVVAISAEGIPCARKGRGPSIAAIDRDGDNVVVVLEEFKDSRPIALGAIIPNPGPHGSVFLRARGNAFYGRPSSNQGYRNLCKIG